MRAVIAGCRIWPYIAPYTNYATGLLCSYAMEKVKKLTLERREFPISMEMPYLEKKIVDMILKNDPELVGLSCYCWDADALLDLVPLIKRRSPRCIIAAGGPSVSFEPEQILENHPALDVVVSGEGEDAFVELLTDGMKKPEKTNGILPGHGAGGKKDTLQGSFADLEKIPSPYLTNALVPIGNHAVIEISRGCPCNCKYCTWNAQGRRMRFRDMNDFHKELVLLRNRGITHVMSTDSAINYSKTWFKRIGDVIRDAVPNQEIAFCFGFHPDFVDEDFAEYLDGIRLDPFVFSVETLENEVLAFLGRKPIDFKKLNHSIDILCRIKPVSIAIMLGLPGDTLDGFKRTVDTLTAMAAETSGNRIRDIYVFWTVIFPGTAFYMHRKNLGIEMVKRGIPYVTGCNSFPQEDMEKAVMYLCNHPHRSFIRWIDVFPGLHLKGCASEISADEWHNLFLHPLQKRI